MKKVVSLFVVFVLALSICPAVFATETPALTADPQSLYAQYEEIIVEANETYGCSLYLLPFDEMDDFCSVEEFRERVNRYCESRNEPFVTTVGTITGNTSGRGAGVVTIPNIRTRNHQEDTVTITFYGTFDVRAKTSGYYYVYSQSHVVNTTSANGIILYAVDGSPTVRTVDGGRTIMVTQQFKVYVRGQFGEDTSVGATYILNLVNGNITASSN